MTDHHEQQRKLELRRLAAKECLGERYVFAPGQRPKRIRQRRPALGRRSYA